MTRKFLVYYDEKIHIMTPNLFTFQKDGHLTVASIGCGPGIKHITLDVCN
jgi:hypothetical protein